MSEIALVARILLGAISEDYLTRHHGVDQKTIVSVRDGAAKSFIMSLAPPGEEGHGICLASQPWLDFCGFTIDDVAWQAPKELLQGPLTSPKHIAQMRDFFKSEQQNQEATEAKCSDTLVLEQLVNYRTVGTGAGTKRVPFSFTLTVGRLHSAETGKEYQLFHSHMTDERDLTADEQYNATAALAATKWEASSSPRVKESVTALRFTDCNTISSPSAATGSLQSAAALAIAAAMWWWS
jgi:hypothetical protein